jgi:hypothetical protein
MVPKNLNRNFLQPPTHYVWLLAQIYGAKFKAKAEKKEKE